MREGWKYSTIGDLCDKLNGLWKGKKKPFVNVGVIRNANFTKDFSLSFDNIEYIDVEERQYNTRKLKDGDLIVEKSGGSEKQPVGRTVLFNKKDGEYSFSNFTSVIRIKDRGLITPEFLYKYVLHVYLRGDMKGMQKATTGIHNIEFEKYLAIPVPLLSLSEQQEIVSYLDSSFAKIDAMKTNAKKSLEEAKALFQASLKQMLEPKDGWEEKTLGDIAIDSADGPFGSNLKKEHYTLDKEVRIIQLSNIGEDGWREENTKYTTFEHLKSISRSEVEPNDIVIAKMMPAGRAILCPSHETKFVLSSDAVKIKLKKGVDTRFILHSINSPYFRNEVYENVTGSGRVRTSLTKLRACHIYLPSVATQQTIVTTLDSLKSKVEHLQANYEKITQECDALKQAILRQVFE